MTVNIAVTVLIIKIAASILVGFFAGPAAVYVFNHMPDKWLCDYGQTVPVPVRRQDPQTDARNEMQNGIQKRIKENPWRWVYSVGFICLCLRLSLAPYADGFIDVPLEETICSSQIALAGLAACWVMLIIALADIKYMIIPDQFVLFLALTAIGFAPMYESITQPLMGFAIGGGFMLICAVAGKIIYKQDAFGFGDVKLCGAMGLVLGINGTVAAIAAAVIISGFVAAAGLATKRYKKNDQKPLGPYLCGCGMAYILVFAGQFGL
ncbi:MAG: prepilin peptidase [Firmicutes bacterium]|nr:prepilin peptidase [Bacillota bacterium]